MYNVLTNCNTVQVHAGMGGGGGESGYHSIPHSQPPPP